MPRPVSYPSIPTFIKNLKQNSKTRKSLAMVDQDHNQVTILITKAIDIGNGEQVHWKEY
jgi:hypothetical protein